MSWRLRVIYAAGAPFWGLGWAWAFISSCFGSGESAALTTLNRIEREELQK